VCGRVPLTSSPAISAGSGSTPLPISRATLLGDFVDRGLARPAQPVGQVGRDPGPGHRDRLTDYARPTRTAVLRPHRPAMFLAGESGICWSPPRRVTSFLSPAAAIPIGPCANIRLSHGAEPTVRIHLPPADSPSLRISPSSQGKTRVFRHFGGHAGRQRRQRRAKSSNIAPRRGSVSVGRYSSTAALLDAVCEIGGTGRK
jgi:hypothetical protein